MKLLFWPLLLCCLLSACDLASGDQHINQGADFYAERNFEAARIELRKALDKPLNMYEDKMLFTLLATFTTSWKSSTAPLCTIKWRSTSIPITLMHW